jgi:hypothetical protein
MSDETRQRIVEIARAEIGPSGKGSSKVTAYWREVGQPSWTDAQVAAYAKKVEWCGGFTLWCLHQAGVAKNVFWKDGLGYLEVKRLPKVREPKPGDVAYFNAPFQHHAVVERLANDGLHTIDGNTLERKGSVRNGVWPKHRPFPHGAVFYSIEPLLAGHVTPDPVPPALKRVELKRGDKSEAAKELQTLINAAKVGVTLVVDGSFGPKTENGVKAFQASRSLVPNGICGAATWLELDKLS